MPEGPEIYKASVLVNTVAKDRVFTGKVVKNPVNWKNPEIPFEARRYSITSVSKGKELMLTLTTLDEDTGDADEKHSRFLTKDPISGANESIKISDGDVPMKQESRDVRNESAEQDTKPSVESPTSKSLSILFGFGMSGKFMFTDKETLHKHAHLMFYTNDTPPMILSFVDVRRFGRWHVTDQWSPERSPDPIKEYGIFRQRILDNLKDSAFNKPICEVMTNQKYFNGIGNYLRAEIIYRAGVRPFDRARDVLEPLLVKQEEKKTPDLLELCNLVPTEVINLPGAGYDPEGNHSDYSIFNSWLQCYYNPNMKNLVDGDGRTIWFKGDPGPLSPKVKRSRGIVKSRKRKQEEEENTEEEETKIDVKKKRGASLSTATRKKKSALKTTSKGTGRQGTGKAANAVENDRTRKGCGKAKKSQMKVTKKTPRLQNGGKRASQIGKRDVEIKDKAARPGKKRANVESTNDLPSRQKRGQMKSRCGRTKTEQALKETRRSSRLTRTGASDVEGFSKQ